MSKCVEQHKGSCKGELTAGRSRSGATMSVRCEVGWDAYNQRMDKLERELNQRYPKQAPADFDPLYAGEHWDEDY